MLSSTLGPKDSGKSTVSQTSGSSICSLYLTLRYEKPHGKVPLIQDGIAELKKELKETAAGQRMYSQLETLVEKQLTLLRRIDKERKAASDAEILDELQREYTELREQIDNRLRQMQQLKLTWSKRFFSRKLGRD